MSFIMLCPKCLRMKPDNGRDSCDDCFLEQRLGKEDK